MSVDDFLNGKFMEGSEDEVGGDEVRILICLHYNLRYMSGRWTRTKMKTRIWMKNAKLRTMNLLRQLTTWKVIFASQVACLRVKRRIIDEGKAHMLELAQLAEKDPEFYKYLQENDRELLEFEGDEDNISVDEEEEGSEVPEEDIVPRLTMAILKKWQKALLEVRFQRLMIFI